MSQTTSTKPVLTSSPRKKWDDLELDLIIVLYRKYANPATQSVEWQKIIAAFQTVFPDRGGNSIGLCAVHIKGRDIHFPAKGLDGASESLKKKLHAVDPARFPL